MVNLKGKLAGRRAISFYLRIIAVLSILLVVLFYFRIIDFPEWLAIVEITISLIAILLDISHSKLEGTLMQTVLALTPRQRAVMELLAAKHMTLARIAENLGVRKANVNITLKRLMLRGLVDSMFKESERYYRLSHAGRSTINLYSSSEPLHTSP